jgi:hypothetical protein
LADVELNGVVQVLDLQIIQADGRGMIILGGDATAAEKGHEEKGVNFHGSSPRFLLVLQQAHHTPIQDIAFHPDIHCSAIHIVDCSGV